jgi:TolB protein
VYASGPGLVVQRADGTESRQLTRGEHDTNPVWSPEGGSVAFVRGTGRASELYTIGFDGSSLRRLTQNRRIDGGAVWSPDGRKIAYVEGAGSGAEIFVTRSDGSYLRRLTRNRTAEYGLDWSPDSRRLLFLRPDHGDYLQSRPFLLDTVSGMVRPLSRRPTGRAIWLGRSPYVLAASYDSRGDLEALLVDSRTGQTRTLASEPMCSSPLYRHDLTSTADGTHAAFSYWSDPSCTYQIDVLDTTSGSRRVVKGPPAPSGGDEDTYRPSFSPDGTQLAYVTSVGNELTQGLVEDIALHVASIDGSGDRAVARGEPYSAGCLLPSPTWSPDGSRIAWLTSCDGPLLLVDVTGTRSTVQLPIGEAAATSWRPGR